MPSTRKGYAALKEKTFENTLTRLFQTEFRFLGGPAVIKLIVNRISDLVEEYYPRKERLHFGQMLWFAIEKGEKKNHYKGMQHLKLKPVILSVVTSSDIDDYAQGVPIREINKKVTARLHKESFKQEGVMPLYDTALILHRSIRSVYGYFHEYQKETGEILPSRGTVHDIGGATTHKEIIVKKHRLEGKDSPEISRETNHSMAASDRYIKHSNQVEAAMRNGVPSNEIPQVTGLSKKLVDSYIKIIETTWKEKKRRKKQQKKDKQ